MANGRIDRGISMIVYFSLLKMDVIYNCHIHDFRLLYFELAVVYNSIISIKEPLLYSVLVYLDVWYMISFCGSSFRYLKGSLFEKS